VAFREKDLALERDAVTKVYEKEKITPAENGGEGNKKKPHIAHRDRQKNSSKKARKKLTGKYKENKRKRDYQRVKGVGNNKKRKRGTKQGGGRTMDENLGRSSRNRS